MSAFPTVRAALCLLATLLAGPRVGAAQVQIVIDNGLFSLSCSASSA